MENQNTLNRDLKLKQRGHSLGGELFYFLRKSRKYWLFPLFLMLFLFGAFLFLGGTGVAPLIYTLF